MMARDLHPGVRVTYADTPCTVLSVPTTKADRFGRPTLCVLARREDTGEEGTILYGEDAQAWLAPSDTILAPGDPVYTDAAPAVLAV